uniref:WW domain-containing protein n=1 Tax=Ditylenchus dipsaci TaxID=166011 RepID=A0A915D8K0_9BILA
MVKQRNPPIPTFLEGTPGFYVKRESPPRVPSTAPAPSKAEATGTKPTTRSLSGSTVSLMVNPNSSSHHNTTPMGASGSSTPALIASNLYASAASIATVGGFSSTPTKNPSSGAFSAITNFSQMQGMQQDVGRRRLSHTPIRPKRRAAPRHELSSHSFNNPPSSYSQNSQIAFHNGLAGYSAIAVNSNAASSNQAQGFPHTKIESISKQFKKHNVSTSLQSLSGKSLQHMGSSILHQNSVQLSTDPEYYVDHNNKRTHWIHPLAQENLIPGWIKIFDDVHGVVYYNDVEKRSQYEHPGLVGLPSIPNAQNPAPGHPTKINNTIHTSPSVHQILLEEPGQTTFVEDLNIIENTAVPEWIRMYSEAPFEADHLLNWKMFKVPQLEHFDEMLMKLYKQDAINTVIKYERPRREINQELARRISS